MQDYVLYHANCPDGFGAAWAAWRRLGERARYVPVRHGVPPPALPECSRLFLVDFAYPLEVLDLLRASIEEVTVIDHHKSAQLALERIQDRPPAFEHNTATPGIFALFDLEQSGATLSWQYFNPESECPPLLEYVRDRDLWKHELPESRAVNAAIGSFPLDFSVWTDQLAGQGGIVKLISDGQAILRKTVLDVEQICGTAMWTQLGGYRVPVVNATGNISDIGNRLCELFPQAPFSAVYRDTGEDRRDWSLRSIGSFDVSEVAKIYGGGGHPNASGFRAARPSLVVE